jgi:hypothetical protein
MNRIFISVLAIALGSMTAFSATTPPAATDRKPPPVTREQFEKAAIRRGFHLSREVRDENDVNLAEIWQRGGVTVVITFDGEIVSHVSVSVME